MKQEEVEWDKLFDGTAGIGFIPQGLRDLHLRILRLEGKEDEAQRLEGIPWYTPPEEDEPE